MISSEPQTASAKILPGLYNLVLVVTLLLVFLMASRTPLDSDLWWHLRSGQVMAETGKPLLTDIFSYTRSQETWVNHSWLSEVVLYDIYQITGWSGLSAWMGLMAALVGLIIWRLVPGGAFTKAGFTLLASLTCSPLWTPRPQFFSLLFLAILIWLIDDWLNRGGKSIWLTLPLFILWSNMHGGYLLGILYLLMCSVGLVVDALPFSKPASGQTIKQAGTLLLAAICGFALTAINPNGILMWLIPFQTVGVGVLRQLIQEWASPDFHAVEVWPYALWIVLIVFLFARTSKKTSFKLLFPALFFLLLALYARRNIAASVLVSVVMLSNAWQNAVSDLSFNGSLPVWLHDIVEFYKSHRGKDLPESQKRIVNLVMVGLLGMFCFFKLAAVTHPVLMDAFETKYYPKDAVAFMRSNPPIVVGRLFNAYNWGGYITWKDPDTLVFVDGRTDLFGDQILGEWLSDTQANNGWVKSFDKWDVSRVMIEPDRPLVNAALANGWVERYRDKQAVILDRKPR
jgi:hypothetical protein